MALTFKEVLAQKEDVKQPIALVFTITCLVDSDLCILGHYTFWHVALDACSGILSIILIAWYLIDWLNHLEI